MRVPLGDLVLVGARATRGRDAHVPEEPGVVGGEGRVIETPVLQIVGVPFTEGEMGGYFHPVSLSLIVSVHRWCRFACLPFNIMSLAR